MMVQLPKIGSAISPHTVMSLRIEMFGPTDSFLAHATAFIVERDGRRFLVTNRHCVTGKNSLNEYVNSRSQIMPESIVVNFHLGFVGFGVATVPINLYDDDRQPVWYEHPRHGRRVDVVAIPFDEDPIDVAIADYSVDEPTASTGGITVGDDLFVVGYPFHVHEQQFGLASWTRATVASEPSFPFARLPCFLIDARTRTGQSGSPVLDHLDLGIPSDMAGRYYPGGDTLVGIYSGRTDRDSDLGYVWRIEAIREVIDGRLRPDDTDALPQDGEAVERG